MQVLQLENQELHSHLRRYAKLIKEVDELKTLPQAAMKKSLVSSLAPSAPVTARASMASTTRAGGHQGQKELKMETINEYVYKYGGKSEHGSSEGFGRFTDHTPQQS
jgi:hypothetical protein